jgi:hypothetical protein
MHGRGWGQFQPDVRTRAASTRAYRGVGAVETPGVDLRRTECPAPPATPAGMGWKPQLSAELIRPTAELGAVSGSHQRGRPPPPPANYPGRPASVAFPSVASPAGGTNPHSSIGGGKTTCCWTTFGGVHRLATTMRSMLMRRSTASKRVRRTRSWAPHVVGRAEPATSYDTAPSPWRARPTSRVPNRPF